MTIYNNFKFGVEIEFTGAWLHTVETEMQAILAGTSIDIVREGYNHNTRPHWKITTDATVTENRNYSTGDGFGGELVSPVLDGVAGFIELEKVLDALNSIAGVTVDVRCGLHVHLSWAGMQVQQIKNIVKRYAQFETQIDSFMPSSRKANNSRWCSSIAGNRYPLRDVANHQGSLERMAGLAGRYYKVNLQCLSRYGTIEFRQHSGTTDNTKISNWVKFLMEFCEASADFNEGATTSYKREKKIAFGEIREQVAAQGWDLRFANNGYKLFDSNGNFVEKLTMDVLETFYVNCPTEWNKAYQTAELSDAFVTWFAGHFGQVQTDSLTRGVSTDVKTYLTNRAAQLAA